MSMYGGWGLWIELTPADSPLIGLGTAARKNERVARDDETDTNVQIPFLPMICF